MGTGWSCFFQTRTIRRELGVPPETLQNRDVLDEHTGMYLLRVSGGTPSFRRIPDLNPFRTVPTERRDTGTYLLRHAASPSMGRSGADMAQASLSTGSRSHLLPVGSRSQEVGTRIPA